MKLKANDTLFISSVKSDNILPGEQFEVSDAEGKRLIDDGLATLVRPAKRSAGKTARPPKNKMQPTALNKAAAPKADK